MTAPDGAGSPPAPSKLLAHSLRMRAAPGIRPAPPPRHGPRGIDHLAAAAQRDARAAGPGPVVDPDLQADARGPRGEHEARPERHGDAVGLALGLARTARAE